VKVQLTVPDLGRCGLLSAAESLPSMAADQGAAPTRITSDRSRSSTGGDAAASGDDRRRPDRVDTAGGSLPASARRAASAPPIPGSLPRPVGAAP